jgi:hypothetical protein
MRDNLVSTAHVERVLLKVPNNASLGVDRGYEAL